MKICLSGKGGSGKSLIAVLMARSLQAKGYKVLLVDADESNLGLRRMLGLNMDPEPIMATLGGKPAVQEKMLAGFSKYFSESREPQQQPLPQFQILPEKEIRIEDLPSECIAEIQGIMLVRIGKIEEPLEGCACPMGALSRDFLTKLTLGGKEIALVDMEAGIEHFGRGVESNVDLMLILVEPSFESILLAEKASRLAAGLGLSSWVILNKVTPESVDILGKDLESRGVQIIGQVDYDPQVFKACLEGKAPGSCQAQKDVDSLIEALEL